MRCIMQRYRPAKPYYCEVCVNNNIVKPPALFRGKFSLPNGFELC